MPHGQFISRNSLPATISFCSLMSGSKYGKLRGRMQFAPLRIGMS
jgi:hypothetical protein